MAGKTRYLTTQEFDYIDTVMESVKERLAKARTRYPQPNYVLTKLAEEAGEVVKAAVHLAEGRDSTIGDLENECVDTIAMCLRLLIEGDQVHGVPSALIAQEN